MNIIGVDPKMLSNLTIGPYILYKISGNSSFLLYNIPITENEIEKWYKIVKELI